MPFLIGLSVDDCSTLPRMKEWRRSFVETVFNVMQQNPDIFPPAFNKDEHRSDKALDTQLEQGEDQRTDHRAEEMHDGSTQGGSGSRFMCTVAGGLRTQPLHIPPQGSAEKEIGLPRSESQPSCLESHGLPQCHRRSSGDLSPSRIALLRVPA